jgi:undecaprenyl-diphosphatase
VEYEAERWINRLMHHHPLMGQAVVQFSTWGIALFSVLAVGLWLLSPPGDTRWKRACAAGLGSAALGLAVNQAIAHVWDRARPYDAHHAIVPLMTPSADPSFPSDHATAAFSIAFGIFFVSRRAGWWFLAFAGLIAVSRVLAGMHYPTDVLASFILSAIGGFIVVRFAMERILVPLISVVSRLTDPLIAAISDLHPVRRTILDPRFRGWVMRIIGAIVTIRIAYVERPHLIDELPIILILAWACVTALGVRLATTQFWPAASTWHRGRRLTSV